MCKYYIDIIKNKLKYLNKKLFFFLQFKIFQFTVNCIESIIFRSDQNQSNYAKLLLYYFLLIKCIVQYECIIYGFNINKICLYITY